MASLAALAQPIISTPHNPFQLQIRIICMVLVYGITVYDFKFAATYFQLKLTGILDCDSWIVSIVYFGSGTNLSG